MKKSILMTAGLAAGLGLAGAASAATDAELSAATKAVVESNLSGYNAENPDAAMSAVHKSSPEYASTQAALAEQFRDLDVKATLVDFDYMGHDDEFIVARVKTKLTGPPGSGFADNVVDSLVLFHQENGVWKLWSDEVLGVDFVGK
jgi:hypothetical protein